MEFDELVVKESPGLCRCCLSEGCYKDLGSEYTWMSETEVYADMLLECFDISITQHTEGPNGPSRLICEVCITRLRDACNFKKQVLDSEKKFVDMVGRGEFGQKVMIYQTSMRLEGDGTEAGEVEYLDDDMHFDDADDEPLRPPTESTQAVPEPSASDEIIISTLKVKGKRGRPRKVVTDKVEKKPKLSRTEDKPMTSKAVKAVKDARGGQKPQPKPKTLEPTELMSDESEDEPPPTKKEPSPKEKRRIMISNVTQVLINSTVMAFRWLKSSYRCFYCYDIFQETTDLKSHQETHLSDDVKVQAMNNYWEPVVYVDISNISCKLCTDQITDLYQLIDHLIEKHGIKYNKEIGVCMLQFRLESIKFSCIPCGATFYTFGPLLQHTNKDHRGTSPILCDICGQNFKDHNLLKSHIKNIHENIGALCTECGEKFDTKHKLRTHQKNQHDIDEMKFKCLICPELFQSHYKRSRHMADQHKTRQEIKCLHCPKTFIFRSMMTTHVRDAHLKVRNHVCGVCGFKAFNSNRLKNHMFKHSGEKNFKCERCDKAFTTKKIMKAHFMRMHKNVQMYDNSFGN